MTTRKGELSLMVTSAPMCCLSKALRPLLISGRLSAWTIGTGKR